jgi:hypothetical protein
VARQNPTRLTPRQARAAAMLASGRRVSATAKAVPVHRATLWEWTKLPAFQQHMNDLRQAAWRSARDRMRENAARAAQVLGDMLQDAAARPQDRIAAARVVLAATGPLFPEDGTTDAVEGRGLAPVAQTSDWSAMMMETARKAGELAGSPYQFAKTPGAAWVESGLAQAFPGSFDQLRALAGRMDEAKACCRDLLVQWQDSLDREALGEEERENEGD